MDPIIGVNVRMEEEETRVESGREKLLNKICKDRKWSVSFLLTLLGLCFLTFLFEREILRTAGAISSGSAHHVDSYGDRIKIKTSDAGIFVGIKKKIQVPIPPQKDVEIKDFFNSKERDSVISDGDGNTISMSDNENNVNFQNSKEGQGQGQGSNLAGEDSASYSSAAPSTSAPTPKTMEKTYYVFKGIPYAQVPEGDLRWKEPRIVDIKSSAQDNTKYKPACSQWSREGKKVIGSEDCLYLNIFTPHIPPTLRRPFLPNPYTVQDIFYQQRHLYPVLIYIHGGDLLFGSGNDYSAQKLLSTQDVILVTFNYRLGIFGFFSSGDDNIPGNYGLLDQISAIKWVHKYIQRFGGNPTRVTIFGDVGHLLLSPLAVGLFQGAIWMSADSSNMFSPPGNQTLLQDPRQFFLEVAKDAKCIPEDFDPNVEDFSDEESIEILERKGGKSKEERILDCLKLIPTEKLVKIQASKLKFHSFPRRFVPVKDVGWRDFPVMMDDPEVLMEMGTLVKVPIIAGVNAYEGYSMLLDFTEKVGGNSESLRSVEKVRETLWAHLRFILEGEPESVYDAMFDAIWNFYFGEPQDPGYSKGLTKKLLSLFGDLKSHAGFWKLCKKLTRNSKPPAFAYVFNYQTSEFHEQFYQDRQFLFRNNANSNSNPKRNMNSSDLEGNKGNSSRIPPWQDLYYILDSVEDSSSSWADGRQGHRHSNEVISDYETGSGSGSEVNNAKLEEDGMEEVMVKIWTSFANYGTPKQAISEFENWTKWQKIEPSKVRYYDLTLQPGSMKTSFRNAEALFWYETLPEVRELAVKREEEHLKSQSVLMWALISALLILIILIIVAFLIYCLCCR